MGKMLHYLRERTLTLLRASERYTKTDMVYLAGNGFWLTLGQVAIGLIAFLLSIAFAHLVPKDVYGEYRFLVSVFWVIAAFSLTGIAPALTRAVARGEDGAYPSALKLSLLWSIPMAFIGLGTAAYYFLNGNDTLAWGCVVIAAIGPLWQGAYLYGSYLEGKQAFRENALAGIVLNVVPALGLLAAMFLLPNSLTFLGIYLGASVVTAAGISLLVVRTYRPQGAAPRGLASLSGHFSAMNVLNAIAQQADRILVFHFLGAVELAVYTFATAVPDQIKTLFNNVATLALPRFVKRSFAEARRGLGFRIAGMTGLAALAAFAYLLIAPFAFRLIFPTYMESVLFSQIYALSLIPVANIVPFALLEAHAAKQELYILNAANPLFQIIVLTVFVSVWGIWGAVISRIVSRAFNLLLGMYLLGRYERRTA